MSQNSFLIVEDHPVVAMVISDALEDLAPSLQVLSADSVAAARAMTIAHPRAIVADLSVVDANGLSTLNELHLHYPGIPILIYTACLDPTVRTTALQQPTNTWLSKQASHLDLLGHLEALLVRAGLVAHKDSESPSSNHHQSDIVAHPGAKPLTWRQVEIMQKTAQGLSAKQVAQVLGLSPETVRGHIREIFKRLNVCNKAQAVTVFIHAQRASRQRAVPPVRHTH